MSPMQQNIVWLKIQKRWNDFRKRFGGYSAGSNVLPVSEVSPGTIKSNTSAGNAAEQYITDAKILSLTSRAEIRARKTAVQNEKTTKKHNRKYPWSDELYLKVNSDTVCKRDMSSYDTQPDIWSTAFQRAVHNLEGSIELTILEGSNIRHLFEELENLSNDAVKQSAFLRGLAHLRSAKMPLERLKRLLDIANPVTNIEPRVATAFGVVKSIITIAISLAGADQSFAKKIKVMLDKIDYIDNCDTFGRNTEKEDILQALVPVYQKLLEFYAVAFKIFSRRGVDLILHLVWEQNRLPNIIDDFVNHISYLNTLIHKATAEIAHEIRTMMLDTTIAHWLDADKIRLQYRARLANTAKVTYIDDVQGCNSLLEHPEFKAWYNASTSQRLLVFGGSGCEKTNGIKYLLDKLSRESQHQHPPSKVCYHFCEDCTTGQATYVLSVLMLSLLEQFPGLKKPFYEWYKHKQANGDLFPANDPNKLGDYLKTALRCVQRPLYIIIDGLDKCDALSRNNLLDLFQDISLWRNSKIKILLSSSCEEAVLVGLAGWPRV